MGEGGDIPVRNAIAIKGRFLVKYILNCEVGGINRLPCPGKVLGL